jgi:hypothetical protein
MAGPLSPSSAHAAKYVDAAEFRADLVPANGKVALITGVTGECFPDRNKSHSAATTAVAHCAPTTKGTHARRHSQHSPASPLKIRGRDLNSPMHGSLSSPLPLPRPTSPRRRPGRLVLDRDPPLQGLRRPRPHPALIVLQHGPHRAPLPRQAREQGPVSGGGNHLGEGGVVGAAVAPPSPSHSAPFPPEGEEPQSPRRPRHIPPPSPPRGRSRSRPAVPVTL